jgi:hypothetical protein
MQDERNTMKKLILILALAGGGIAGGTALVLAGEGKL